jgi:ADP-ribosylglycohydrolase
MNSALALSQRERILGGLWGALIGDALGVPVEFRNRADVQCEPVVEMRGFGTHRQPSGTWSDDGALVLCTADSLVHSEFDTGDMGSRFVKWMNDGLWTATGVTFDVGCTTADALTRIANGTSAEEAGGRHEDSNGNGSLMRIIPVALRFANEGIHALTCRIERASAITHGHDRSRMACVFYSMLVSELLRGQRPKDAVDSTRKIFASHFARSASLERFHHILEHDFSLVPEGDVVSTGYVLHTLHASLWCLLTTSSYRECVLKAVNLGGDTDTTGCVAGGLAGVAYGLQSIPHDWKNQLPRQEPVGALLNKFMELCVSTNMKGKTSA